MLVTREKLSGGVCIHSGMAALQIVVPYQPLGLQMRGCGLTSFSVKRKYVPFSVRKWMSV